MGQILRYVELSEEPAYPDVDTYVPKAQGSGVYLNIASTTLDVPGETQIDVPTAFGRASVETEPGYYAPTGNVAYAITMPTLGHFLKGLLGGYAFTAGVAGVAEVQRMAISAAADADGGGYSFALPDRENVMRTYNLVAAAGATIAALAAQVDAVAVDGWTSVSDATGVTFTRTGPGANALLGTFSAGTSGAAAAFSRTTSGVAATPSTHEFWGSDNRDLPSWLVRAGKDLFEHCFQGLIMESMELTVEDALTNLTMEMNGQKDFKASEGIQAKTAVQAALPKDRKVPFHKVCLTIDGVLQKRKAKTLTVSVANGSDPEAGRYLGSRHPGRISANERVSTVSTDMDFSDLAALERIWGGPSGPTEQGAALFPAEFEFRGGISPSDPNASTVDKKQTRLVVKLPSANYQTVETQPSGREEMTQPVTMQARTGTVILLDGVTAIATDIYARLENWKPMIQPPA